MVNTSFGSDSDRSTSVIDEEGPECPKCDGQMWTYRTDLTEEEFTHTVSCTSCPFAVETMSNLAAEARGETDG